MWRWWRRKPLQRRDNPGKKSIIHGRAIIMPATDEKTPMHAVL